MLAPGSDADIVVYDPNADHVIRAEDMVGAVDYNPYEGVVTKGSIRQVWLRASPPSPPGRCWPGRRANTWCAASASCEAGRTRTMLDKTLGYILCCQSPGLFVLALLLLVEFLGRRRHRVKAFFRLLGCILCAAGGVALYFLGIYKEYFTIRDFFHIRSAGWVGLVIAAVIVVLTAVRAFFAAAARRGQAPPHGRRTSASPGEEEAAARQAGEPRASPRAKRRRLVGVGGGSDPCPPPPKGVYSRQGRGGDRLRRGIRCGRWAGRHYGMGIIKVRGRQRSALNL